MSSNFDILEAIRDDLFEFSDPQNVDGFVRNFYAWVVREWTSRSYFITEIANFGFDLTNYPQKTDFRLCEKVRTYREFIHANNGHHYAAFFSGQGTACETLEKDLYEFFHESMRLRAMHFIAQSFPHLDAEDFWNQIFCEVFTRKREILVVGEISDSFGFYGLAAEPYTCSSSSLINSDKSQFADWSLEDFKYKVDQSGP
ncbi:MAG: hypothetical protein EOP04_12740, partial [Proteobacteria bacterium]